MLQAVTNERCLNPPEDSCDVCGLIFFPTWAFFMPGNFWVAQCSYINKLTPPLEFESKQQSLARYLRQLAKDGLLASTIFPDREDTRGLGRFAAGTGVQIAIGIPT